MKRDEFDPDEHEPTETTTVELTLTIEMYEFGGDNGWIEARWFVVKNNINDFKTIVRDESEIKRFWIDIATELKRKTKNMWKK